MTIALCTTLAGGAHAQEIRQDVEELWDEEPIVDGLLEPLYLRRDDDGEVVTNAEGKPRYDRAENFIQVYLDSGVNVFSGKFSSPCVPGGGCAEDAGFSQHADVYDERLADGVHFGLTAADLSCRHVNDSNPEFLLYQQKLWPLAYSGDDDDDRSWLRSNAALWFAKGLRILQLEYSPSENERLYEAGEQFAGRHSEIFDPGLTKYGDWLARWALEHGGILDVSHSRNATVNDTLALAAEYAGRRNRTVPVLANHANLDDPEFRQSARNKSLDEACRIAATGGTIGLMPIAGFLPAGATFASLIDQMDALRDHDCPHLDWKGQAIELLDHLNVATDAAVDYNIPGQNHYLDDDAARTDRWKWLASRMRERGYSIDRIRKIFGANHLRALRAGLHGQLPFEPDLCGLPAGELYVGDFDGEGRDDLLFHGIDGRTWIDHARRGGELTGTNWKRSQSQTADQNWCRTSSTRKLYVGDFDGNGRDDLLCQQSDGRSWIDYANGQGTFYGTNWSRTRSSQDKNWCSISSSRKLFVGDFNGDGRDDLLCHQSDGRSWIDYANSRGHFHGTNWSRTQSSQDKNWCSISSSRRLLIGDFNGDGRDDLLCHQSDGRSWIDYANNQGRFNGTNWSRTQSSQDKNWCRIGNSYSLHVGDFSGDGRDDLLCHGSSSGKLWLDRANLSGRFNGTNWSDSGAAFCRQPGQSLRVADANGDGRSDLLCFERDDGWLTMFLGRANDLVSELEQ